MVVKPDLGVEGETPSKQVEKAEHPGYQLICAHLVQSYV